ncbi:UbiD family decarboxylase [Trichophyton interdigitale]|uniref:Rhodopsin domain-containing protein n=1 Tax=Trichophyton interdigitale (strain MR816) TaxID=1215338 RepID=A0A059IXL1_TRIIM|nr:hypothetical protein H101_07742 [Trichophyton interdigitale H6]KAG5202043.1 UbiD family decarboxylase [Trichophyton interdigitale]KAG5218424.1 UbiD family decarboxylase [Trichophyton interdigitale]KAG8206889.1 UbiD family decarboxylase [Trichophyton interdigitale]KDB20234.1 hypothetical protein H109_07805 [Trichophyton interdigitale MR816]
MTGQGFTPEAGLDTSSAYARAFQRESWTLYGVGIAVIFLRSAARIRRMGIRNLQLDDYLILCVVVFFTLMCVALNEIILAGGSNLVTAADIAHLTPESKQRRTRGAKWVFVAEHAMILTTWTLKACMIVLYRRIMEGLSQERLVLYLTVWLGLGFVGTELALFLTCRPLHLYWAIPPPVDQPQCSSYQVYGIVQGIFAISSDVLMLAIAIPLFMTLRLPHKQKMILLFVFGMGIFVVIAAVLTKVYCLVPWLISYVYMNWYLREATVGILVTCLPMTWSLLRDFFPMLARWMSSTVSSASKGPASQAYHHSAYPHSQTQLHSQTPSQSHTPSQPQSQSQSQSSSSSWWTPFCRHQGDSNSNRNNNNNMMDLDLERWESGLPRLPTIDKP